MQCYHKSAGAAFITVLAIIAIYSKNKKCNTQVSKSGSECISVTLNSKKNLEWGGGGDAPGPPRYAGAFGSIP